ncbi:MAG: TonB family protein, partial [Bacteroidales bacterium]|nr:TonB family protein [Bacteroidales bacterium]
DNISAPNIIPPKPVCGKNDYKKYIKENIQHEKLPDFDKDLTVKLSFIINTNGEITDIEVIKSQGEDFDNEAIRLLRKGPAWEPATQDDIPVAKKVRLNVKFEKQ